LRLGCSELGLIFLGMRWWSIRMLGCLMICEVVMCLWLKRMLVVIGGGVRLVMISGCRVW